MSAARYELHLGNSLEILPSLPPASVDAVVTDPPYELGFMGKGWDSSGIANNVELWRAVLRVLKPGGHLLAFSGTRTYHRMVCAIEDAGFDIRDQIGWAYGSGFPKSLDVSKAIDACDRIGLSRDRALRFTAFMRQSGLSAREINEATGSGMASHYLTEKKQPAVATEDMFCKLRPLIRARGVSIPEEIEELVRARTIESENLKKRQVVGSRLGSDFLNSRPCSIAAQGVEKVGRREVFTTAAHTEAAKEWEGWGTALKPAWEPIVLARRPLIGTVADNVLTHGVGALNIDGCRVATGLDTNEGRWPANLIHDGSSEVVALFPQSEGMAPSLLRRGATTGAGLGYGSTATTQEVLTGYGDTGSAARFFYCPKASSEDRDEGLGQGEGRRNIHPTVKPCDLMRYLCRLVTPPGGVVLDPFMGSGSTGKGFRFVGIDMTPDYLEIARARIAEAAARPVQTNLFAHE